MKIATNTSRELIDNAFKHLAPLKHGIAIGDWNGSLLRVNQTFADLLGYEPQELIGVNFRTITHHEDLGKNLELLEKLKANEIENYAFEKRYIRKDGSLVWIELFVRPLHSIHPELGGMIAEVTNIEKLKTAERKEDILLSSYRDLMDSSEDQVYILEKRGTILNLNSAAESWLGDTKTALIGKKIGDFGDQERNDPKAIADLNKKAWHGETQRFNWWMKHEQSSIEFEVILSTANYLGQKVLIASVRDISERISIQKKLKETDELLKIVSDNSSDVISLFDADQNLVYISPGMERLTGFTPEELEKTDFYEYMHPEDISKVKGIVSESIKRQDSISRYKYRHLRKDEGYFWIEVIANRLYDERGNILQTVASLRDVDDQVKTRVQLELNEQLLRESQRIANLGTWEYISAEDKFRVSEELARMFGAKSSSLIDMDFLMGITIEQDRPKLREAWNELSAEGREIRLDFAVMLGKRKKYFNLIGYVQKDRNTQEPMLRGTMLDITMRKETEITLRETTEKAEKAARVKQQFLSNMSHELRTPLNGLLGLSEMLMQSQLDQEQREQIQIINNSAHNLIEVIEGILDFTALDQEHLELKKSQFALTSLKRKLSEDFGKRAAAKQLAFHLNFKEEQTQVLADQQRILQILSNLISNAIKFTEEGYVSVSLSVEHGEQNGHRLVAVVKDTGIGIAKTELDHIFTRFFRSDLAENYKYGGTGLGLSVSKKLTDLMGGSIYVESDRGSGAEFTLAIPVELVAERVAQEPLKTYGDQYRHLKVLLAEDNAINQFVFKKMLSLWHIEPDVATQGEEALEMALRQDYDIIFLDVQMPIMDGIDAAAKLREAGVETPIIAVSAAVLNETRASALAAGMNDFIPKPYMSSDIKRILETYL